MGEADGPALAKPGPLRSASSTNWVREHPHHRGIYICGQHGGVEPGGGGVEEEGSGSRSFLSNELSEKLNLQFGGHVWLFQN